MKKILIVGYMIYPDGELLGVHDISRFPNIAPIEARVNQNTLFDGCKFNKYDCFDDLTITLVSLR